ncbi:hypothetical protein [Pseudomonas mosselii]|uniref:hypothetical protein n=1 Tax=Pseudomonas mosselii TaxID=78327 RepID=UPI000A0F8C92|nr:hypothetical protein [Pseudomonas mosselii]MDN4497241.1 hypothetical protein [Pseudomonas mosselii]ORT70216.1 hypothetical protein BTA49_12395 [Pseudomonas mosselii]
MGLKLESTNKELNDAIEEIAQDSSVSLAEFRSIRDKADKIIDTLKAESPELAVPLTDFQSAADTLSDTLQKLAIAIRKSKPDAQSFDNIKIAIEHQLTYALLSYASSVERYTILTTGLNVMANKADSLKKANDEKLKQQD